MMSKINKKLKTLANNLLAVIVTFLLLSVLAAGITGCSFFGKSDYEKGTGYLKDKKFNEAVYEFQKVEPDNKNFSNAQSKISYINGLLAFNDSRKTQAIEFLSKVNTDDEYYHDAQLMIQKINAPDLGNSLQSQIDDLKNKKDTIIIKRDINGIPRKSKEPVDPVIKADLELSKKYVSDAGNTITRFENAYQSAKTAQLGSKSDYSKSMESIHKEFNFLKYSAQNKDAGVLELASMTGEWMNKRIAFIHQLIIDKTVNETETSRSLREEGDRLYTALLSQMNKVKKSI